MRRQDDVIVHLVHGTWGNIRILGWPKKPRWHERGHAFFDDLEGSLAPHAKVDRFIWGWGANLQGARLKATRALVRRIREGESSTVHVFVGHSHGGNICLAACNDPSIRAKVKAVITMATPFLVYRKVTFLERLAFSCFLSVGIILFFHIQNSYEPSLIVSFLATIALMFSPAAGMIILSAGQFREVDLALPRSVTCEVTILRSSGDEASGLLSIAAPINWIASGVGHLATRARNFVGHIFEFFGTSFGWIAWVALCLILWKTNSLSNVVTALRATGVALLLSSCLCFFVISMMRLPFGWDLIYRGYRYVVSTEATPPGKWNVEVIAPRHSRFLKLAHSGIYDYPEVRQRVLEAVLTAISRKL